MSYDKVSQLTGNFMAGPFDETLLFLLSLTRGIFPAIRSVAY